MTKMKPYGRRDKGVQFHSKTDHHIRINNRKMGNWWEGIASPSKKTERQKAKRQCNEEMVRYEQANDES